MKQYLCALVLTLSACAGAQWTVVNLHPAWVSNSAAYGVADGKQVGSTNVDNILRAASLWSGTAGSWVNLNPEGHQSGFAAGVGDGQQVGWVSVGGQAHASLWAGTAATWIDLNPAGAIESFANGVALGQQVGRAYVDGSWRASLWHGSAASWVSLHPTGATHSSIIGTDGTQQVGNIVVNEVARASLWSGTAASWIDLNPVGSSGSFAYDVAHSQQVGRAFVDGSWQASLWHGSAASWVSLHPAGATHSGIIGTDGTQQVGNIIVNGDARASLWYGTAASRVDLHSLLPPEYIRSHAHGVWTNGDITYVVGEGSSFLSRAFMWVSRSVPPASYSMFRGSVFSGNLASLQNSDDNRLVMRPGVTLGTSQPPIQIILNATAPTSSPNGFSFSVESSASFGNAQQKISLYNFTTGLYEELDARLAKTSDDVAYVTVRTNPSRFIEPGTLAIRALVSFRAVGPSLSFPWSGRIDKVWWSFPG